MKISVIIPAHNEEKSIGAALKAVLASRYADFEVIVVDNASSDKTFDVASTYPVKVIREMHPGTMWACEAGLKVATGQIIVRMDADCLPEPDWLSRGSAHFSDPRVAAVSGPYDYHDASPFFRRMSFVGQIILYPTVNTILQWFGMGALTIGGNTFLRADVLEKMGGFNTALTFYGDDTDTAKRAARFGHVVFDCGLVVKTQAPTARRHGGSKKVYKYWLHFFKVIFSK